MIEAELERYDELMSSQLMRVELRRVALREKRTEGVEQLVSIVITFDRKLALAAEAHGLTVVAPSSRGA